MRPRTVATRVPFIEIANQDVCRDVCGGKYCTRFCPAGVFSWDETRKETAVRFEQCLECGACAIGCPYDNILSQAPPARVARSASTG